MCICGLAEVLSQQITKNGPANRKSQSVTVRGRYENLTFLKSVNMRICNWQNLFVDRPPLDLRNNRFYKNGRLVSTSIFLIPCKNNNNQIRG